MFRLFLLVILFLAISATAQEKQIIPRKKIAPSFFSFLNGRNNFQLKDSVTLIVSIRNSTQQPYNKIVSAYLPANILLIKTSYERLNEIISDTNVIFINELRKPKEELTTGAVDFSLNSISYLRNNYPLLNGDSITLSIKEQKFDFNDIDFKERIVQSPLAASTVSSHASIMATIAAGGGNTSYFAKGVAWGSLINSSDFSTLLPDPDAVYKNLGISVQNHSYGTGIENFYGGDAVAYDMSAWNNKQLVHVFSAGNSGTATSASGTYAGITGFANLSGSFKMAKNIITVGHVDSFNTVLPLSSKGPAYDGRIKPELVAFGEDGSSGAAAMVSGAVAVLQQAFKQTHNDTYPSSQLIKVILLNSADDVGAKGIDYNSGYGSLNAYKAVETIKKNNFFEDSLNNGQIKTFSISIPQNTAQIKITLAWNDTAAIANASKALVNDLNISLQNNTTNEIWLPWILNGKPFVDSLLLPAIRGIDTLNNTEQISLVLPASGNYTIQVKGNSVRSSKQSFAIAYQIDTINSFSWTYPSGNDVLIAGAVNVLRWQSNITGDAVIEYSADGGNWQTIVAATDLSKRYFKWNVPNGVFPAQLRIRILSQLFYSDAFLISKPLNLKVGFNCPDSFLLYWNTLGSGQYRLYELGEKYLQPFTIVQDTVAILKKIQHPFLFYSVAPIINNKEGLKSLTVNYTTGGIDCYFHNFTAALINNAAVLIADLGTVYNVASVSFQKINIGDTATLKTFDHPSFTTFTYTDALLSGGINKYRVIITLGNGIVLYSNIESVYYFPDLPVIIYPNPARQNLPVNIIVRDPFVYSIQVYDAVGRLVNQQNLKDVTNQIPPLFLSKGIYFIKIVSEGGKLTTQKLIVQ